MRLNFSGVGEDQIREGIQRLGEVVREQVALYGTITGEQSVVVPPQRERTTRGTTAPPPLEDEPLATVLRLPRKRA
jgi:2-aminoadipate transaminase